MRVIGDRGSAALSALLFCVLPSLAAAQDRAAGDFALPLAELRLADNGDLLGWEVSGLEKGDAELIEPGEALVLLQVSRAGQDMSRSISWRRLPPGAENIGEFVGTLRDPPVQIHRAYRRGTDSRAIVHEVRITTSQGDLPEELSAAVRIPLNLHRHAPGDASLGEVLYGYSRVFAASSEPDGAFEPVREPVEATTAVLAVRHVAITISPDPSDNGSLTVDPGVGITLSLDGEGPIQSNQELAAIELRSMVLDDRYRSLLYPTLWRPLQGLARLIEAILEKLTALVNSSGLAVVVFAVLFRAALFPLGRWSTHQQRRFTELQLAMKPAIDRINANFKGADKSERILQTYKEYGFSPFSGLKSSAALFVQLPVLIAFFSVTTESALFRDAQFLWIPDLSLPDGTVGLPYSIVGLGAHVNMLPIALGLVSIGSALLQVRFGATASPRSGLLLALVFLVLFYSCAAALVLYWLVINVVQVVEGLFTTAANAYSGRRGVT